MKYLVYIIFITLLGCQYDKVESGQLSKVIEGQFCGCVNSFGDIVVPIEFHNVYCNNDSIIPVRINSDFMFYHVNRSELIMKDKYDFIGESVGDIRLGIKKDREFLLFKNAIIDSASVGQISILDSTYYSVNIGGKFVVKNSLGPVIGVESSEIFIDNGFIVFAGKNHFPKYRDSLPSYVYDIGVMSLEGDTIISPGKYKTIKVINKDYTLAETIELGPNKYGNITHVISNRDCEIKKEYGEEKWIQLIETFSGPYLQITEYIKDNLDLSDVNNVINESRYNYVESINGETLIKNNKYSEIVYFESADLFVVEKNDSIFIVNNGGEETLVCGFGCSVYDFYNDYEVYSHHAYNKGLLIISDSSLMFVSSEEIFEYDNLLSKKIMFTEIIGRYKDKLVLEEDNIEYENSDDPNYYRYIYDLKSQKVISDRYPYIDLEGIDNGIIYFADDSKEYVYSMEAGKIVKVIKTNNDDLIHLNVDYQLSTEIEMGELVQIENESELSHFSIIIDTTSIEYKYDHYYGYKCQISNFSKDTVKLSAQDGRLYTKLEVLRDGKWESIETFKNSWCGNSYHEAVFPPYHSLIVSIPKYTGGKQAKMRLNLFTFEEGKRVDYYSNVISGYFNLAQLFNEKEYETTPSFNVKYKY